MKRVEALALGMMKVAAIRAGDPDLANRYWEHHQNEKARVKKGRSPVPRSETRIMETVSFKIPDGLKDRDTVVLTKTIRNAKHDRRRKLPNSEWSAIDEIPAGTKFQVWIDAPTTEDFGSLALRVEVISFKGEQGTPFRYTTFRVMRKTVTHDGRTETTYHLGRTSSAAEQDLTRAVVENLQPDADPLAYFEVAYPELGWEVVRRLAGQYGVSSDTVRSILNSVRAEKSDR